MHLIQRLYHETSDEPQIAGKVTLFTWVIPSGYGDYYAQRMLKEVLEQGGIDVKTVVLVHETQPIEGADVIIPYTEAFPTHHIRQALEGSPLVIQSPTYLPGWDFLVEDMPVLNLGEYGFLRSKDYRPSSGNRSLGLHPLELGVWKKQMPAFNMHSNQYVAYLITDEGHEAYLTALLKSQEEHEEDIDILVHNPLGFLKVLRHKERFIRYGIMRFECYADGQMCSIPIQEKGKVVSIFSVGRLPQKAFEELLCLSGNFVGVRGDISFSEAIGARKLFFFDYLPHKKPFLEDLLRLAQDAIGGDLPLYFEAMIRREGEVMGTLMKKGQLPSDLERLASLIEKDYVANDVVLNMVRGCLKMLM